MCGRVKLPDEMYLTKEILKIKWDRFSDYAPRYNVAPTTIVPVVTSANGERTLEPMRWGLIPAWATDTKNLYSTFNARADSLATKPTFRDAWKAGQRCLIVTDGFYEWRKFDKQPFCIGLGNKQPMFMGGLWDEWRPKGGEAVRSCTIITVDPNPKLAPIHDRMPLIIGAEDAAAWLGEEPVTDVAALMEPFQAERMTLWPVDKRVGNVKNEGRELTEPLRLLV